MRFAAAAAPPRAQPSWGAVGGAERRATGGRRQAAQVDKDAAALKADVDKSAVQTAKRNVERMFAHFVMGLKEVAAGACSVPKQAKRAGHAVRS